MLEIKVRLTRANSAIYATGEVVECLIEFSNKVNEGDGKNANIAASEKLEHLAWASAQLHCYRKTSYNVSSANDKEQMETAGKTALDAVTQAPGDIILATKPKILFCDLKLQPGEVRTYYFSETIPRNGPPTYRGIDIRYFYKITIATQRIMSKVQSLTVPIRVLPIPVMARQDDVPCTEETNEELAPTNPFLEKREVTELEISWHHLKNITARRAPKTYRISNKRGFVGRFCLYKPAYKIGEDIVGSLDFSDCTVRCVQFSVKLQSEEISLYGIAGQTSTEQHDIPSDTSLDLASIASGTAFDSLHISTASRSSAVAPDTSKASKEKAPAESSGKITTFSNCHEVCFAMVQTQVVLPIPLHVTPSFRTNLVDVRWRLNFQFVTSTMMDFGKPYPEEGAIQAPAEIPVETMIWNLPITIYSANPLQIYTPNQQYNLLIK